MQYEVKASDHLDCGGAYIKLLGKDASKSLEELSDATPYIIMFGPDKCGSTNKVEPLMLSFPGETTRASL